MHLRSRVLARVLLVAIALALLMPVDLVPQAVAVTSRTPLNDTRSIGSAPVHLDFPIEYLGVVADLPSRKHELPEQGRVPFGEARFLVGGQWTRWRPFEADGAQAPGQFTGALLSVDGADAYQVRGLPTAGRNWRAAAINTSDGPSVVVGQRRAGAAVAAPRCLSRADWGADESISGWSSGDEQAYSPVRTLTVHHTAGSNDPGQDYDATVRAIYSYHVQSNGWSDIGYQYLVDGHGTVYEGRSAGHTSTSCLYDGGDGSDFAHDPTTDEVVTGAHVANHNTGNVGIALMGCYESASAACTGNTTPTATAVDTLESELALLATRHGLDPKGTTTYVRSSDGSTREVSTISGHRDWKSTECPGGRLYSQLPTIRGNVAARMAGSLPMDSAVVSFGRSRQTVQENARTVELVVSRGGNTAVPASVDYARTSGSATPDSDFALEPGTVTFAEGEATKTIAVAITNDTRREGRELITVSLRNAGPGTVVGSPAATRVVIAPSDQRPDAHISTVRTSSYVGNNIYNTTGYRQTRTRTAERTQVRTFFVRVFNDGNVTNTIAVKGSGARPGSSVRYFVGSNNVTSAMRSSTGLRVTLRSGAFKLVKVRVKVLRTADYGSRKTATVQGVWTGDGIRVDVVKAVVKVTR
jgi:hypothetical protein